MNAESDVKYILLIDDSERDVALFEKAANRNCRAEVRRAATGEDGIHMLLRRDVIPSLIVLEIDLPSGDGYALLRFVREDPELRSIPVVVSVAPFRRGSPPVGAGTIVDSSSGLAKGSLQFRWRRGIFG